MMSALIDTLIESPEILVFLGTALVADLAMWSVWR